MTVAKLIEKLSTMPQEHEVRIEVDTTMSVTYLHVFDVLPTRIGVVLLDIGVVLLDADDVCQR
jgi:hypothetical protein